MKDLKNSVPSTVPITTSKARTGLIFAAVGVFAAIVFGILYLFVLAPSIPNGSLGWFLFSFATGLTMIVLPCTLPLAFVIVPLSMGKGMVRGIGMALCFGIGIATTLSLYGVAAALLGGVAIDALGADLDAIKNWVYFVAGSFALMFALSEIGLMNVHMPTYKGAAPAFIQKRGEFIKAFLLGLFLGNVGVGCPHPATPLILIEIASSGDVLYGWLMFLVHAIGRVLPLLLLSFLAILGVNGLNWLLARKDTVEKATGWSMVFVAGFILTLGLFSHDWWVNSGIHSGLESITQEETFNILINDTLGTDVEHRHGLEEGEGLFGLPLEWGNWFLVAVWILPMLVWYRKRKKEVQNGTDECDEKLLAVKRNFLIITALFLIIIFVFLLPKNFYLKSVGGDDHSDDGGHAEGPMRAMETTTTFNQYTEYLDHESDVVLRVTDTNIAIFSTESDEEETTLESTEPGFAVDEEAQAAEVATSESAQADHEDTASTTEEMVSKESTDLAFAHNEMVKINLINEKITDEIGVDNQEIHFHGQKLLVLSELKNEPKWTDVVNIRAESSVEILVEMSTPGQWVIHQHDSKTQQSPSVLPFFVDDAEIEIVETEEVGEADTSEETKRVFAFDENFSLENYVVEGFGSSPVAQRLEEISFTIKDTNGNPVGLSSVAESPLQVTFVNEANTFVLKTYPGNKTFDAPEEMMNGHDNSDGHHSGLINIAYADAGHNDADESDHASDSYTVPVIFPTGGFYKVFVQFIPEGETKQLLSSYSIEVREKTFTIDNFGWSETKKWWVLLTGSIFSIIPLVWFVRKYINVKTV